MGEAKVEFDEVVHVVQPGERLTFGRGLDCTVCLSDVDVKVSRHAGVLECVGDIWFLANTSRTQMSVVDEFGMRSVVQPSRRVAVEGPVWAVVDGERSYRVHIEVPVASPDRVKPPSEGVPTAFGERSLASETDRLAMVVLFAQYLEDSPRPNPQPTTYQAAAARLQWSESSLRRRIERLRDRLAKAGVPNMHGPNAMPNLAEYALATRLITKDDLRRFRRIMG
jgi:hypothetical protein